MQPKYILSGNASRGALRRLSKTLSTSPSTSTFRPVFFVYHQHRHANAAARYSTDSKPPQGPLIRITDLPAPGSGHIRILELNRPEARNAISRALLSSLRDEIDAVHAQYDPVTGDEVPTKSWNRRFGGIAGEDTKGPTRALILASAVDTSFCAGADLKERKGFTQEE